MEDQSQLKKILKWAGIAALVAIPVAIYLKKRRDALLSEQSPDEDADPFSRDLNDSSLRS